MPPALILLPFSLTILLLPPVGECLHLDPSCRSLPHSNHLSPEELNRVCLHRDQWIRDRDSVEVRLEPTDSQREYLDWLEGTRKVPWKKDKKKGPRATDELMKGRIRREEAKEAKGRKKFVRKEYRMMSDQERAHLQRALNAIKQRRIDNVTIWDLHILVHYPHSAPAAHWGPSFLPWHREFLRQFEAALHNEVPELVGLPYWDSSLDHGLPDPADSVLWAEELMGNGNGFVRTGPFKDWDTNVLMPLSPVPIKRLFRSTGGRGQDRLMSPADIEWIMRRQNFSELTFCHDKTFESMHGLAHVWVGGFMSVRGMAYECELSLYLLFMFVIRVSPNDPTFYLHHAFIDSLWEQFRQSNQDRGQRESDYAQKTCNQQHGFNAQMKPFNLRNRDGLSNDYTDFWFEYEQVRQCTPGRPICDSKFLFCDKLAWRCRSRVQLGGNCTGFAGTEICYESICIQNVCRLPATEGNGFQRRERQHEGVVWAKSLMVGDEAKPMLSGIAHVTVRNEPGGQNMTAFLERNAKFPETMGLLYLPLPNPKDSSTAFNVSLEANDHYGRYCQSYCLNATTEKYQICEPKLLLRSQLGSGTVASNVSFTHQTIARKFLDMDLSVHPRRWKVYSPFLVFNCQRKLLNSASVKEVTEQLWTAPLQSSAYVWFRVGLLKKAGSKLDLDGLQIEAEDLGSPGELFLSSVRSARSSFDQSVVLVRARNPMANGLADGVTVSISVRQGGLRVDCDVRCNPPEEEVPSGGECKASVRLHSLPEQSQEQMFSPELEFLPYLGWRMIGHPSEWRLRMPYLSLYC